MSILLLLIPISLLLLAAAVWAFAWAVRAGQFDDMDTPALDVLRDDPPRAPDIRAGALDEAAASAPDLPHDDTPSNDVERRSDAD